MTSRRRVMKLAGEMVDFTAWLAKAKHGIDVDDDDPPTHELALYVKNAEHRFRSALSEYVDGVVKDTE